MDVKFSTFARKKMPLPRHIFKGKYGKSASYRIISAYFRGISIPPYFYKQST